MREMRSMLGDALYKALIDDFTPDAGEGTFAQARFTELWFGVTYTRDGFSVQFNGFKPAIVYYAYERFIYCKYNTLNHIINLCLFNLENKAWAQTLKVDRL